MPRKVYGKIRAAQMQERYNEIVALLKQEALSIEEIASRLELSYETARRALSDLVERNEVAPAPGRVDRKIKFIAASQDGQLPGVFIKHLSVYSSLPNYADTAAQLIERLISDNKFTKSMVAALVPYVMAIKYMETCDRIKSYMADNPAADCSVFDDDLATIKQELTDAADLLDSTLDQCLQFINKDLYWHGNIVKKLLRDLPDSTTINKWDDTTIRLRGHMG